MESRVTNRYPLVMSEQRRRQLLELPRELLVDQIADLETEVRQSELDHRRAASAFEQLLAVVIEIYRPQNRPRATLANRDGSRPQNSAPAT